MPRFSSLSDEDLKRYLGLVEQSLLVRRHFDLLLWLQGDVQRFLPHEVMLAGWGDFRLGMIAHDIVSALPGVRTARANVETVSPLLAGLFQRWIDLGRVPYVLSAGAGGFETGGVVHVEGGAPDGHAVAGLPLEIGRVLEGELGRALKSARSALIHGICDERGRHDCLYVLFSRESGHDERARKVMDLLLPYLDTALRQVPQLRIEPEVNPEETLAEAAEHGLSDREMEIMTWVKLGKTNQEIGMILDISAFTVKNHLKRIFKKLAVYNRMQAVSRFEALLANVAN
jgi:transcriptional regulator EpsA